MKKQLEVTMLIALLVWQVDVFADDQKGVDYGAVGDPKNGNLNVRHTDFRTDDFQVVRIYNSTVAKKGMFGNHWCSEFESSIEVLPEGNVVYRQCGAGRVTYYAKRSGVDSAIATFVNQHLMTIDNDASTDADKAALRARLLSDYAFRVDYARQHGIFPSSSDEARRYENGRGPDYIQAINREIVKVSPGGRKTWFNANGRVARIEDEGRVQVYIYNKDRLTKVIVNGQDTASIHYDSAGRVDGISLRDKSVKYGYAGGNLVDVASVEGHYKYVYTSGSMLTGIQVGGAPAAKVKLESDSGRLLQLARVGNGCTDDYTYPSLDASSMQYSVVVRTSCTGEPSKMVRYTYWTADNRFHTRKALLRSEVKAPNSTTVVRYDGTFEQPTDIDVNGEKRAFTLDNWGRITEVKSGSDASWKFTYDDDCGKVSGVTYSQDRRRFYFDTKCRVVSTESNEKSLRLMYNNDNMLSSISDNTGRAVLVSYDKRTDKPAYIEIPGDGAISVTYKANGEIAKVDSPQGTAMAMRVAALFNDLLDLIQVPQEDDFLQGKSELRKFCACSPDTLMTDQINIRSNFSKQ